MKIGIDKNTLDAVKDNNEYIYIFNEEPLEELINTKLHCIYYKNVDYVDINLTVYIIVC